MARMDIVEATLMSGMAPPELPEDWIGVSCESSASTLSEVSKIGRAPAPIPATESGVFIGTEVLGASMGRAALLR
jgi:hypothetical protein